MIGPAASQNEEGRHDGPALPGTLRTTWLIGARAARESLQDRSTRVTSAIFAVIVPCGIELGLVQPQMAHHPHSAASATLMAVYLLVVGLGPSSSAISIAAGVFAGEMEKGNLAPLLATPAPNLAIFAGKILGAVLPSCLYALIAELIYLGTIAALNGLGQLGALPAALTAAMLLLVPLLAIMEATLASLISSRARTYTGAQTLTSLVLLPVMGAVIGAAFAMRSLAAGWLALIVVTMLALDLALIAVGAARWRREEVLARQ